MAIATNILQCLVPISQFNKGQASKIFDRLRSEKELIVLKNNQPSAIILSPEEYTRLTEIEEDYFLLLEANKRLVEFLEEAKKDLKKLDHSVQLQVVKGIEKVRKNPLPTDKGGYGKPLGNKNGINLTNLLKIKFRDLGIRVVYKLEYVDDIMKIIVISARTDEAVYKEAAKRREKNKF